MDAQDDRQDRWATALVVWTLSAVMAGIGGALYVPQVGIINPSEFAPANSIEAAKPARQLNNKTPINRIALPR